MLHEAVPCVCTAHLYTIVHVDCVHIFCAEQASVAASVGLARTIYIYIYIRCIYGIFGREIIKYTAIYGAIYTVLANPMHVLSTGSPCLQQNASGAWSPVLKE